MINLSKHIEILLLEHDCVIVPKLGGFITNQVEARYEDNFFVPPYRTIGFNKNLLINDGLLVQSYMQVYDASYPDAYKQMEMDIDEVLQQLDLNGVFQFEGIGLIRKSVEGNITFEPSESGMITPELYGLCALEVKNVNEVRKEKELINTIQNTSVLPIQSEGHLSSAYIPDEKDGEEENVTIRLHRRWVDVSIAAVVSVLLFFLFSYPSFRNSNPSDTCVAGSLYVGKENNHKPMETVQASHNSGVDKKVKETVGKVDLQEADSTSVAIQAEENISAEAEQKQGTADEDVVKKEFVLVLASYVSKANSAAFIENLKSEGFTEAEYIRTEKISRIIYSGYASKDEAADSLNVLRKQNPAFKEAWILKI
ncbi:MAG: SPOR domain-containing protein [Prevotellaceae bacterium]|nr:SPOR domain-containing protein [Prevotellaceae bacterium]